jgi:hypothetical protein
LHHLLLLLLLLLQLEWLLLLPLYMLVPMLLPICQLHCQPGSSSSSIKVSSHQLLLLLPGMA